MKNIGIPGFAANGITLHKCSQLWVTPKFIDQTEGWSWHPSGPWSVTLGRAWRGDLDVYLGHYFVYENESAKAVWRIVRVSKSFSGLLGKWPD